jgi:CRISPR-associated exonuclease Cas4
MGFEPPEQAWVKEGKRWHTAQEQLYKQRLAQSLSHEVKRKTNCYVQDLSLGLHGYIDEFQYNQTDGVVVEYKSDNLKPNRAQILQLVAYAMAATNHLNVQVYYGILLKGNGFKQHKVNIESNLKLEVIKTVDTLRKNLKKTSLPNSSAQENKCIQCEYLRYCNDR